MLPITGLIIIIIRHSIISCYRCILLYRNLLYYILLSSNDVEDLVIKQPPTLWHGRTLSMGHIGPAAFLQLGKQMGVRRLIHADRLVPLSSTKVFADFFHNKITGRDALVIGHRSGYNHDDEPGTKLLPGQSVYDVPGVV